MFSIRLDMDVTAVTRARMWLSLQNRRGAGWSRSTTSTRLIDCYGATEFANLAHRVLPLLLPRSVSILSQPTSIIEKRGVTYTSIDHYFLCAYLRMIYIDLHPYCYGVRSAPQPTAVAEYYKCAMHLYRSRYQPHASECYYLSI